MTTLFLVLTFTNGFQNRVLPMKFANQALCEAAKEEQTATYQKILNNLPGDVFHFKGQKLTVAHAYFSCQKAKP